MGAAWTLCLTSHLYFTEERKMKEKASEQNEVELMKTMSFKMKI